MANSSEADLMSLGDHCSVPSCRQVDFLPFTCDCCTRVFCLDHRSYAAHSCPAAGTKQTEVIVCPLCARGVRLRPGQDPNTAFEEHTSSSNCDPTHYAKVHNKPRCPVGNCREKLSLINTYHCKTCNLKICLKHRLPDDHGCAAAKGNQAASMAMQRVLAMSAPRPSTAAQQSAPARAQPRGQQALVTARKQYEDPSNSLKGTAQRRMQQAAGGQPAAAAAAARGASNANPLVPPHLPEECPQCHARFADVARLVQHVEEWHPAASTAAQAAVTSSAVMNPLAGLMAAGGPPPSRGGGAVPAGRDDVFRCHTCQARFHDPVALVQHSEACGRRPTVAAGGPQGSGASSRGDCTIC